MYPTLQMQLLELELPLLDTEKSRHRSQELANTAPAPAKYVFTGQSEDADFVFVLLYFPAGRMEHVCCESTSHKPSIQITKVIMII